MAQIVISPKNILFYSRMDFPTTLASSGITGAVILGMYFAYKCCYKKRVASKCCCGEMTLQEEPAQVVVQTTPQLKSFEEGNSPPEKIEM